MSNHLKHATSPYLLQHAENPVDWYPWCDEAFDRAREEDRPVFLSIGYSTCHWCHVMAHESFESREVAEILNRYFISIKVDREERPDIDSVYMSVCQAFTHSGGWPMSIFMTWDKKPFFAGTYFPVRSQHGMPGFADLLHAVVSRWNSGRKALLHSADQLIAQLKQTKVCQRDGSGEELSNKAVQLFSDSFDDVYGGFGSAPKFPVPHNLLFLMLYAQQNNRPDVLKMAEKTLIQMRKGGIFDQIGHGFSRYSTDRYFLAPHFEKMLYDNALLIVAYAAAHVITQDLLYLDTAEKTAQYILREMTAAEGGFYSAQDADSEGVEGKYYTFTAAEVMDILGKEKGREFSDTFDITTEGNFEGVNIPNLLKSDDLNAENADFYEACQKLYSYRRMRSKLHLDDKLLLSWNSLMIAAMSVLYRASKKEEYLRAAVNAQQFIERNLIRGRELCTSWRNGTATENSFLDDYVFYGAAMTEPYHSTWNREYLEKAEQLCRETVKRFADRKNGGFFLSDPADTELFMNPKEAYDGAIPSGNSVMTYNLVRLYQLTGKEEYRELAEEQICYMSAQARDYPAGYSMFLLAKLIYDEPPVHIVIALKDDSDLKKLKEQLPFFANVIVITENEKYPIINGSTTFYVCKNHTCYAPTNTLQR